MASSDPAEAIFEQADVNKDGVIDKKEFRDWLSSGEGLTSRIHELSIHGQDRYAFPETTLLTSNLTSDTVIHTSSSEETMRYLERSGHHVYVDRNPQMIRRGTTERPERYEQRVILRSLQPPPLPSQEPLIIKEVRPEQPPLPAPLIVRERTSYVGSAAPLILRERPPIPPPRIPGETKIVYLPPVPVPPRSLIVERYPPAPKKPGDIIIERWLPYGAESERRTIHQYAPPPIKYPAPTHTVIVYDAAPATIVRKFERAGITQENPDAYVARYGASLLDPVTLTQLARNAGVTEDITSTWTPQSVLISTTTRGNVTLDQSNDLINQSYATSAAHYQNDDYRSVDGSTTVTHTQID
jgi:hypothetical protein